MAGYTNNCGANIDAHCWTWDICPTVLDEFDLVDDYEIDIEAEIEADSWLSWYGGWGSFGMGTDGPENETSFAGFYDCC